MFVIEFRNGGLFQNLKANNSGPLDTAQRFPTEEAARAFMDAHDWIYFNGGMAIPIEQAIGADPTTQRVVRGLPKDEAEQYRALLAKPPDELTEEERTFLRELEVRVLRRGLAIELLVGGKDGSPSCTCLAGVGEHRRGCPLYGRPSLVSTVNRLLR